MQLDPRTGLNAHPTTQSAWALRSPVGPLTTLPIVAITAIALFAPTDILQKSAVAASFVALVSQKLLVFGTFADIRKFADSTEYPQVALLVSSLHWTLLPVQALLMIVLTELSIRRFRWSFWVRTRGQNGFVSLKELLLALSMAPIFIAGLVVITMIPGDWSLFNGLTTSSRLGMASMFLAGFWLAALGVQAGYGLLRAFFVFNILKYTPDSRDA